MLATHDPDTEKTGLPAWDRVTPSDIWRWPLVDLPSSSDRFLTRMVGRLALGRIARIDGWENILPQHDPFILAANHSCRREAVFLPALLMLARAGRPVRFLADWNFRLIPGVGRFYNGCGAITVTRKDARPRVLNRLKPLFRTPVSPHEEVRRHLVRGGAVGIFPEGTVNRDASHLLRGRRGAARLSLESGVPVVPLGIRFGSRDPLTGAVDSSSPISLHFGPAMQPPDTGSRVPSPGKVTEWHACLMVEIARLCGKTWPGPRGHEGDAEMRLARIAYTPAWCDATTDDGELPC